MNAFEPWVDFNHNDANYQSIIERMAKVKWIEGVAITTPTENSWSDVRG
jgi:hypothetical protein